MLRRGVRLLSGTGDLDSEGVLRANLGISLLDRADARGAIEELTTALKLFSEIGNRYFTSATLIDLGRAHAAIGEYGSAKAQLRKAMALAREVRVRYCEEARALRVLGEVDAKVTGTATATAGAAHCA